MAVLLLAAVCVLVSPAPAAADPLEGLIVREIHVAGLHSLRPEAVTRHLATRVGQPFRRATLAVDRRRLDELRLFTAVALAPRLDTDAVVLDVSLTETVRLLPAVAVRVTDENGVSAGLGMRGINVRGRGMQSSVSAMFGGETQVGGALDSTTITPGTWALHAGASYSDRRNALYDFDERATSAELRVSRNFDRGLRLGGLASLLVIDSRDSGDSEASGATLSPDGTDVLPTMGGFVTLDTLDSATDPRLGTWAELEVDHVSGNARSWTFILDARRFQRLSERHGLGLFSLASFQTGEVGVELPEYLQYALGGSNSVRGWSLGSRLGRNQFIGTAEYTCVVRKVTPFSVFGFHAYAGLQAAVFADAGAAWSDSADRQSAIDGYGAGLRVLVPFVDLIRIDMAWGEPGTGAHVYFGIALKAARQRQRVR